VIIKYQDDQILRTMSVCHKNCLNFRFYVFTISKNFIKRKGAKLKYTGSIQELQDNLKPKITKIKMLQNKNSYNHQCT